VIAAVAGAAVMASAIALPHVLRLEHATPGLAAAIWLSALILRALAVLFAALAIVTVVPATELFHAVTHWCWEHLLPGGRVHLGLDGHTVGDVALMVPALLLAASGASLAFGIWGTARAVRRVLHGPGVVQGPRDSAIVSDPDPLVAVAGIRRPRVVVSAGALASFDDEELAASLEHEHGHVARRHHYALVLSALCRVIARPVPGTDRARRELTIHLERDADRFALQRDHAPAVLASAISKVAQSPARPDGALLGEGTARRVDELLRGPGSAPPPRGLRATACFMVAATVGLLAALPPAAAAAVNHKDRAEEAPHCDDG
jgi:hypothetical protein